MNVPPAGGDEREAIHKIVFGWWDSDRPGEPENRARMIDELAEHLTTALAAERAAHISEKIYLTTATETTERERDEARAESERLRAALSEAMRVFQGYAAGHAAKRTAEGDQKAATNHTLAAMCGAALGAAPAPASGEEKKNA
jgi:hypothetical protein